jgi:tripeptidyl-peptidase-1
MLTSLAIRSTLGFLMSISIELINGEKDNQNASTARFVEANLYIELILAISGPLPVVEYITDGFPCALPLLHRTTDLMKLIQLDEPAIANDRNEPYLTYHEILMQKTNAGLTQVISNSYGDEEQVK